MEQVKTSLEEKTLEALDDIAREKGRSISGLVREAVLYWLEAQKKDPTKQ